MRAVSSCTPAEWQAAADRLLPGFLEMRKRPGKRDESLDQLIATVAERPSVAIARRWRLACRLQALDDRDPSPTAGPITTFFDELANGERELTIDERYVIAELTRDHDTGIHLPGPVLQSGLAAFTAHVRGGGSLSSYQYLGLVRYLLALPEVDDAWRTIAKDFVQALLQQIGGRTSSASTAFDFDDWRNGRCRPDEEFILFELAARSGDTTICRQLIAAKGDLQNAIAVPAILLRHGQQDLAAERLRQHHSTLLPRWEGQRYDAPLATALAPLIEALQKGNDDGMVGMVRFLFASLPDAKEVDGPPRAERLLALAPDLLDEASSLTEWRRLLVLTLVASDEASRPAVAGHLRRMVTIEAIDGLIDADDGYERERNVALILARLSLADGADTFANGLIDAIAKQGRRGRYVRDDLIDGLIALFYKPVTAGDRAAIDRAFAKRILDLLSKQVDSDRFEALLLGLCLAGEHQLLADWWQKLDDDQRKRASSEFRYTVFRLLDNLIDADEQGAWADRRDLAILALFTDPTVQAIDPELMIDYDRGRQYGAIAHSDAVRLGPVLAIGAVDRIKALKELVDFAEHGKDFDAVAFWRRAVAIEEAVLAAGATEPVAEDAAIQTPTTTTDDTDERDQLPTAEVLARARPNAAALPHGRLRLAQALFEQDALDQAAAQLQLITSEDFIKERDQLVAAISERRTELKNLPEGDHREQHIGGGRSTTRERDAAEDAAATEDRAEAGIPDLIDQIQLKPRSDGANDADASMDGEATPTGAEEHSDAIP